MKKLTKPVQAIIGHLEAELQDWKKIRSKSSPEYEVYNEVTVRLMQIEDTIEAIKSGNLKEKLPF